VFAAGSVPVGAVDKVAAQFPKTRFVVVGDVLVEDKIAATDPETGTTEPKPGSFVEACGDMPAAVPALPG
jgi:hypothetical protein